jgi:hypothetical protein
MRSVFPSMGRIFDSRFGISPQRILKRVFSRILRGAIPGDAFYVGMPSKCRQCSSFSLR